MQAIPISQMPQLLPDDPFWLRITSSNSRHHARACTPIDYVRHLAVNSSDNRRVRPGILIRRSFAYVSTGTAPVRVIDLFAGPGGLGEGFSCAVNYSGRSIFKIALSIEKESAAQKTLVTRAFYRQFQAGEAPRAYYNFLAGKLGRDPEDQLFKLKKYLSEVNAAKVEARRLTLGRENQEVDRAIGAALGSPRKEWVLIGGPPCSGLLDCGAFTEQGSPWLQA